MPSTLQGVPHHHAGSRGVGGGGRMLGSRLGNVRVLSGSVTEWEHKEAWRPAGTAAAIGYGEWGASWAGGLPPKSWDLGGPKRVRAV